MKSLLKASMRDTEKTLGLNCLPTNETKQYYQGRLVHMCREFCHLERPLIKSSRPLGAYARDSFVKLLEMVQDHDRCNLRKRSVILNRTDKQVDIVRRSL